MKVMILGIDGYIGWPLALREIEKGNEVSGIDNFFTRRRVREVNSDSVIPISTMQKRISAVREKTGARINFYRGDVANPSVVIDAVKKEKPDVVVHLAEQSLAGDIEPPGSLALVAAGLIEGPCDHLFFRLFQR